MTDWGFATSQRISRSISFCGASKTELPQESANSVFGPRDYRYRYGQTYGLRRYLCCCDYLSVRYNHCVLFILISFRPLLDRSNLAKADAALPHDQCQRHQLGHHACRDYGFKQCAQAEGNDSFIFETWLTREAIDPLVLYHHPLLSLFHLGSS